MYSFFSSFLCLFTLFERASVVVLRDRIRRWLIGLDYKYPDFVFFCIFCTCVLFAVWEKRERKRRGEKSMIRGWKGGGQTEKQCICER